VGVPLVAAVAASGLVNAWFLVGPEAVGRLLTTLYGRLLVLKLALFGLMLALAAANRFVLTAVLERALRAGPARSSQLTASVLMETALAAGVLTLVSWMGALPPASEP
jgi:putative copper resistance protein D